LAINLQIRRRQSLRALALGGAVVMALALTPARASADATPVGPLPKGPVTTVVANRGSLVSVALPRQAAPTGLVWRLARPVDPKILREVAEGDVGPSVVVVFRAAGPGHATIAFALTRGDTSPKALRAVRYSVRVR
jgi:hypothetical protein